MNVVTVGHGTLGAQEFASLVRAAGIEVVVDVRRFPGSRRHPHFARDGMSRWLADVGVEYEWAPDLGGRRKAVAESPNVALRNLQFRAYADHMATEVFADAVERLVSTSERCTAVMCSESVWWRCHRRLLADHLALVEGAHVFHLFHDGRRSTHPVTPGARRTGRFVTYDAPQD